MKTTHAKRTEMSDFETAKYRMKQGFKVNSMRIFFLLANLVSFGLMVAIIFKLLSTLSRIA